MTDKLGPDISVEKPVVPEKPGPQRSEEKPLAAVEPQLSDRVQALLGDIETPAEALEKSREYQQDGQFGLASLVLQHGIKIGKKTGDGISELTDELEYYMPVLQAKELLVTGQPDEAEVILKRLADNAGSNEKRAEEIAALRGALGQSRFLATARRGNERDVTRAVRKRLSDFYKKRGSFPTYSELNQLLPVDDKVLQNYEIIYFKSVPNAYRMVLRNLHNKENLLKIEATGLIK